MEMGDTENIYNTESPEKAFLNPEHPLLEKFQQALKEHLLFQINRMKDEIFEIELETNKKSEEREKLGVQTYEAQQMVCTQQRALEELINQIETVNAAKEEVEKGLDEAKRKYKGVQEKYLQTEKVNRELQTEIESVTYLTNQMNQWEQKIESHISVNKRISSKTKKDYKLMFQEKRQQDMLILNLTTIVWKLESEIETLDQENKMREKQVEELEQVLTVGNTNIEALQTEIRCLMHSWNSVVVAISNRDKGLECLNEEYRKLQEKLKSVVSEIEQVKKLTKKELKENEYTTMVKSRILEDLKRCQDQMNEELMIKDAIEREMIELKCIIDQIGNDTSECKMENDQQQSILNVVMKDYNKMANIKNEIEEKMIRDLENLLANDKVAKNLTKILTKIKIQRREVEIIMYEAENKSSLLSSQIESQKFNNSELTLLYEDIDKQQMELTKDVQYLQSENDKYTTLFKKRERQIDRLINNYEKETEKRTTITSPKEMVILELEKNIEDREEHIKKLQSFWLREQKNMLSVSKERQEQIQNLNLLKQQIKILEQKNLNINADLEVYKKNQDKVIHNINNLQNKIINLCETIFKKRNQKEKLDRSNILIQTEYETKLRDAELDVLQIETDIAEIEEDKVNFSKELIEINREALEWEKKMQIAKETVNQLKSDRGKSGETESMKLEIHKMEVIYGQMKKAQEKLLRDLTFCISRRDNIYYASEARIKKEAANKQVCDIKAVVQILKKTSSKKPF